MDYYGLFWTILEYFGVLGLLGTIKDYYGLLAGVRDY